MRQILTAGDTFLFDLDGTLVITNIDFAKMKQFLIELGHSVAPDAAIDPASDIFTISEAVSNALPECRHSAWTDAVDVLLTGFEREGMRDMAEMPGAHAWLAALRHANINIAVVTRNSHAVAEAILAEFSLPYDVLVARDDVLHVKPHPAHLLAALNQLHATTDHACMIGDHWMDITAARRANLRCAVGVLGEHLPEFFTPCPADILVTTLCELPDHFSLN